MKNNYWKLGFFVLLALFLLSLLFLIYSFKSSPTPRSQQQTITPIASPPPPSGQHGMGVVTYTEIKDICGKQIDYTTSVSKVNSSDTVEKAFEEYVNYMKSNGLKDGNYAVDWIFKGATPKGFYEGKFYWVVDFHYFTEEDREKGGNSQVNVSEDGEITRLFGCI